MERFIILHHEGGIKADSNFDTSQHKFEDIERYHKEVVGNDIQWIGDMSLATAYNYIVDKIGKLTQARTDWSKSWHTYHRNYDVGICFTGNFSRFGENSRPSQSQEEICGKLLAELCEKYNVPTSRIVPHRFFRNTDCFGRNLSDDYGRKLAEKYIIKKELIKKQISLLEKLIQLYTLLLIQLRQSKLGKMFGGRILEP